MKKRDIQESQDELLLKGKRYQSFTKLLLMILNICLSPFYFGYTIAYLGTFTFDIVIKIYGISMDPETAQGLYNGCVPVGGGIGALTSFILIRRFSRKNALLIVNVIALVFGAGIFIENQYIFLICRIMQGVCVGFYSAIAPLIIKEFAPTEIAGTLGAFNQLFVAFGVFFACLFQYILGTANDCFGKQKTQEIQCQRRYWYVMFGFTLVTVFLQTMLFLIVYRFETPKYLLEKNREDECKEVLKWIYHSDYVEEVLSEKKADLGLLENNNSSIVSADSQAQPSRAAIKRNKLRFAVAIHLATLQQFVGINAVVIYGTQIAKEALSEKFAPLIPVVLNLEQTLASLITSYLLTRLGRKIILQAGTLIATVCLFLISIGFIVKGDAEITTAVSVLVLGGLVIYMANFGLSLGPVVWLYIPEILEPDLIPFSTGANWAVASLITILFPILKNKLGSSAPLFMFYGVYSALGLFFSQKFVLETKGKTEKQIYNEYEQLAN